MDTREILELVQSGSMSIEEAEGHFRRQPFEDMGFAKLDRHRKIRSGFPEVIFSFTTDSSRNIIWMMFWSLTLQERRGSDV